MKLTPQQSRKILQVQSEFIDLIPEEYELDIRMPNRFVFIYKDIVLCYKINLSEKLESDDYRFRKESPDKSLSNGHNFQTIIEELRKRLVISQLKEAGINMTRTNVLSSEFEHAKKILISLEWKINEKMTKMGNGKFVVTSYVFYKPDTESYIEFTSKSDQYILYVSL